MAGLYTCLVSRMEFGKTGQLKREMALASDRDDLEDIVILSAFLPHHGCTFYAPDQPLLLSPVKFLRQIIFAMSLPLQLAIMAVDIAFARVISASFYEGNLDHA